MKYKVIVIFILALVSNVLPCYGAAHDVEIDGLYYKLSFNDFTAKVVGRDLHNTNVVIPNEISINGRVFVVNTICESAFNEGAFSKDADKYRLKSVKIGDNVKTIYHYAFANCKNLAEIILGSNIKNVESRIFMDSDIKNLEIVDDVKEVGVFIFSNTYKGVYVHDSLNSINSIQTCFIDVPIFDIRANDIGTMIVSGVWNIPEGAGIRYQDYNGDKSYIRNSYFEGHGIKNLIINADNKYLPSIYDADIQNLIVLFPVPPKFNDFDPRNETYLKTTLYVPDDSYDAYMSHPEWRRFLNIKKFSEIENSLSPDVKSKLRFTPLPIKTSKNKYKLRPE